MKNQVSIGQDRLDDLSRSETVEGINLIVSLSPYATPRSFWSDYSNQEHQITLGFDYSDREPVGRRTTFDDVTVSEGRYSGKVITIAIPVDDLPDQPAEVNNVKTKALNALRQRQEKLGNKIDQILNQTVASKVIEHDLDQLLKVREVTQ